LLDVLVGDVGQLMVTNPQPPIRRFVLDGSGGAPGLFAYNQMAAGQTPVESPWEMKYGIY
jgi:hypothetical protein